jgi:hypothetical protein
MITACEGAILWSIIVTVTFRHRAILSPGRQALVMGVIPSVPQIAASPKLPGIALKTISNYLDYISPVPVDPVYATERE